MLRPITAREASKLDSRHRVYRRMYDHFDYLPAICRAALREAQDWHRNTMLRCAAGDCNHHQTETANGV